MSGQSNRHQNYSYYPNEGQYPYTYVPQGAGLPDQQYLSHQHSQYSTHSELLPPRAPQPQVLQQSSHHALTSDVAKHRRSRSGCLTCRSRRVKCNEVRPICERCEKGNRECVYPQPGPSAKQSERGKGKAVDAHDDDEEDEEDLDGSREASHDADNVVRPKSISPATSNKAARPAGSHTSRKESASGSTTGSAKFLTAEKPSPSNDYDEHWSQILTCRRYMALDPDIKWFLNWHKANITHYHYHLAHGSDYFVKCYLIEQAMTSDSLLYAIVSFTAYFHAVASQDGKLSDFLGYYGKALTYLREAIANRKKMRTQTLLTILQLSGLEEHFGDWVTLVTHQKAGYKILTEIYTLESVVSDHLINKTLEWYMRFDLHAGFIAGRRNVLSQEWFEAHWQGYRHQVEEDPGNIVIKCDERLAYNRFLATKVTALFAKHGKGALTERDFTSEADMLREQFKGWTDSVDPQIIAPAIAKLSSFGNLDDILAATHEHLARGDDTGPLLHALISYWGMDLMFRYQLALAQRKQPGQDTLILATKIFAVFGVVMLGDPSPAAILTAHAPLNVATLFVHDAPTIRWSCLALVRIESQGYVYPPGFRKRMSDTWGIDVSEWWLPNEEGQTPFIKAIQEFTKQRDIFRATAPKDRIQDDGYNDDIQEMTGIFTSLELALSPTISSHSDSTPERGVNASSG